MNFTINIEPYKLDRSVGFSRLIEHIRRCVREREKSRGGEQQRRTKIYSTLHYTEHLKRCMHDNPLIGRALLRFYSTIKNFASQENRVSSTALFDTNESKLSLVEDKTSIDRMDSINSELNLSKISLALSQINELNPSQPTTSTQSMIVSRPTGGLMTKKTLAAINKAPYQRTKQDIEVLEHLLNRCESLRRFPANVRHYTARSLLLLPYHHNTILTRQNTPPFLVYILVYGQCRLLLDTNPTVTLCAQLNVGDVYGDDALQFVTAHRLNGLITNEINPCHLIAFFPRDLKAYENYLSDAKKQLLLEQLRTQTIFHPMQWRIDLIDYFLEWSRYRQYFVDEIIYGNEDNEHGNLYFILHGQVSFVRLLDFPSKIIKHPPPSTFTDYTNPKRTWRFLDVFILSNGHYFGFESSTNHAWYIARSSVDIISISKIRFQQLGLFGPMIFEKLREDFFDIFPEEIVLRRAYFKYLQSNRADQNDYSYTHLRNPSKHDAHLLSHNDRVPEQHVLNKYKENLRLSRKSPCL